MAKPGNTWGFKWSVQWGNPYTEPPDGTDRVQIFRDKKGSSRHYHPDVKRRWEELGGPGSGWAICVDPIMKRAPRKLSENRKRSLRRTKLWNRLNKTHPLFAEQFYREKLASDPDNYGVTGMLPKNYPIPKGGRSSSP